MKRMSSCQPSCFYLASPCFVGWINVQELGRSHSLTPRNVSKVDMAHFLFAFRPRFAKDEEWVI
ncbi:unnamed protein product [Strongylus vulgaris]|uniref:Uncharacterized protein n=1 Tax=Strongylus vulgaris TaxID=40348 RepID=A0A3P7IVM7_STRVU|nr:unnamed protein product [Strongylus vulgaris]